MVTWCSKAVNRNFRSPFAALRTRSSPLGPLSRLGVRRWLDCSMFSLVILLPSTPSAGGCPPLFGCFAGTTTLYDSPPPCMWGLSLIAFPHRPTFLRPRVATGVAVGTTVTRCPPHGPVLARLAHTVLTLDVWRRSAHWDRDVRCEQKEYGPQAAPESAPRSNGSVGSAAEAGVAIDAARLSETLSFAARCPVRRGIGNTPLPQTVATSGYPRWTRAYAVAAAP